eukprot:2826840-Prymnesium_polylepis.1
MPNSRFRHDQSAWSPSASTAPHAPSAQHVAERLRSPRRNRGNRRATRRALWRRADPIGVRCGHAVPSTRGGAVQS